MNIDCYIVKTRRALYRTEFDLDDIIRPIWNAAAVTCGTIELFRSISKNCHASDLDDRLLERPKLIEIRTVYKMSLMQSLDLA